MRGSMSLVCFVCDDAEVQKTLPQILLVKKQFAPAHMLSAIMAAVQPPLAVWVVENSWMTAEMVNKVLTHLSTCLQGWAATHQIILSADAYRSHIAPKVWRRAAALKIMMFVIPAKMTWALQPCDTHVFAKMKHYLACEVQAEMIKAADRKLSVLMVVVAVNRAVRQVVTMGNWRMAFWDLGLTGVQACISETCLQKLEMVSRPRVPNTLPSLAELMSVFPGRTYLPIDDMFRMFITRARPPPVQPVASPAHILHPVIDDSQPWLGRLRSSSALGSQDNAPAESRAPCRPPMPAPLPAPLLSPPPQTSGPPRARRLLPWLPRPPPQPQDPA